MAFSIRRVDYFYTTVQDQPGEGYRLLSELSKLGINLIAFTGVPVGPMRTQFTVFPDDSHKMASAASNAGLELDGPHPALLVQGDDELGALAEIHGALHRAKVNVYASSGVADGQGSYGYILYVRPDEFARAAEAFDL